MLIVYNTENTKTYTEGNESHPLFCHRKTTAVKQLCLYFHRFPRLTRLLLLFQAKPSSHCEFCILSFENRGVRRAFPRLADILPHRELK